MDNQLLKILKSLKAIEPNPEFTKRSRAVILAASRGSELGELTLRTASR